MERSWFSGIPGGRVDVCTDDDSVPVGVFVVVAALELLGVSFEDLVQEGDRPVVEVKLVYEESFLGVVHVKGAVVPTEWRRRGLVHPTIQGGVLS